MICLNIKYIIIIIIFLIVESGAQLGAQDEIYINITSNPPTKFGENHVVVNIGETLYIWCTATESMRAMRLKNIDFDSYDPIRRRLLNITWNDKFKWDPRTIRQRSPQNNVDQHNYIMELHIGYVTIEHRGWQICYINEYTHQYVYLYVPVDPTSVNSDMFDLIVTKPNKNITIPCIPPIPEEEYLLMYSSNFSYNFYSWKRVPDYLVYKKNKKIGLQVAISTPTRFFCVFPKLAYYIAHTVLIDKEEDNDFNPIFNEKYSVSTYLGTDLKMECIYINSNNLSISFNWHLPQLTKEINKTHINNNKIEVMANISIHTSELIVKNTTINDLGFYKCSVFDINKNGTRSISRQIFKKANKINELNLIKYFNKTHISLNEKDNCLLVCEAPYPVTWTYVLSDNEDFKPDNVFIYSSLNSYNLAYQSVITINLATYKNNGFYFCHETNTSHIRKHTDEQIFIYVLKDVSRFDLPPNKFTTKKYLQKHSPTVTISCVPFTMSTTCSVSLGKNFQKQLTSSIEIYKYHYECTFDSDIDADFIYECYCGNKGIPNYFYTNDVIIKTYESFEENTLPYVNLKYDKNVTVGEELIINCTILRYCKQCISNDVIWSYNVNSTNIGERINTYNKYVLLYNAELYLSTLVIKNVQKTDNYEYQCSVADLAQKINIIIGDEKILVNYYFVWFVVTIFVIITITAIFTLFFKQVKLQSKIRKTGLSNFNKGVKGIFNPRLYINLQADMLPYDKKLEIPRNKIKIGKQLGSGNFGIVYKADIFGQFAGETVKTVAIKMIKKNLRYEYIKSLIIELKILSILGKHINIIDLLGACTENIDKMELLVILEYCHYGNIRDILRNKRNNFINLINIKSGQIVNPKNYDDINNYVNKDTTDIKESSYMHQITTNTLINWAYQISCGMEFMTSRKVLHGDLAARNVLLNENNIVKICDFGLSKNLSLSYNYQKKTQCPLPIKWMAIESIRDKTFSSETDVWSFGVVLWELFSLSQTPYSNIQENIDFFQLINSGYRMEQPQYSTKEIYQMMFKCWAHSPKDRPTFTMIKEFLESVLEQTSSNDYLYLSNEDEENIYLATSL